jgi:ABC-type branched-subunit amino acid transport system substrate-binding protein
MIGTSRRRLMVAASSVAIVGLALTSIPAQAASIRTEVGVSKTEVVLGTTVPMSGIAAPGYSKVAPAMQAFFDYVNDNGGIYGRKIRLVIKDDRYSPQVTKAKTQELILKDKVFATIGSLGTGTHKTVISDLNRRGIPDLFPNTGFSGFNDPKRYKTTFTFLPSYQVEAKILGQYIKENYAGKKIGIITQADDFGRDALAGFKTVGVTFAAQANYASGTQSGGHVTQLAAMDSAGVDVIVFFGVSSATAAALGTAIRTGLRAKTEWIVTSVGSDATTLKTLGVPVALLNGVVSTSFAPAITDDSDPWIKFFSGVNDKYNTYRDKSFDNNVLIGMSQAYIFTQALAAAGKNPTRKGLIAAMEKQGKTFNPGALVPMNYSATNHAGPLGYWFGRFNAAGELKPAGGKYTVYVTDSDNGAVTQLTNFSRPALTNNGLPAKR